MAGALTGAIYGGDVKSLYFDHSEPQNVEHLFFAIRPDLFMSMTDFEARMEAFNRRIKALPRAAGCDEILMPGEPETRTEQRRAAKRHSCHRQRSGRSCGGGSGPRSDAGPGGGALKGCPLSEHVGYLFAELPSRERPAAVVYSLQIEVTQPD